MKNPRLHLLQDWNNSFAFPSVPADQLRDKCSSSLAASGERRGGLRLQERLERETLEVTDK